MYFTRTRKAPVMSNILHYHNPSALPIAPILNFPSTIRSTAKVVHWWNEGTSMHPAGFVPSHEPLPACGFFPPSASYAPSTQDSEDLPWITSTPSDSDWTETHFKGSTLRRSTKSLGRVLTITRVTGKAIVKRRGMPKSTASECMIVTVGHPPKYGGDERVMIRSAIGANKENLVVV